MLVLVLSLLTIELVLDKSRGSTMLSDLIYLVIRPAAGGLVFMAAVYEDDVVNPVVAMLFGLTIAGVVHWYKMLQRPAITVQNAGLGTRWSASSKT